MQNDTTFPATRQDISNLKQTAVDAARDLGSTASVHANRAKGQLGDLAGHAQQEATEHLNQVQGSFAEVVNSTRDYFSARPLASLGIAFGIGVLFGFASRSHR